MAEQKKVALVTGGSAGLGEDIALELRRQGLQVAVCGRQVGRGRRTASTGHGGGRMIGSGVRSS